MLNRFSRWWHEAEENAEEVFASRIAPLLLLEIAALIIFLALFPQRRNRVAFGVVAAIIGFRTIAEKRRAVIFSSNDVISRQAFGPPPRIPLREVMAVKKVSVARTFAMRAYFVLGVELTLRDGQTHRWPLDFLDAKKIIEKLQCDVDRTSNY